MRALFQHLEIDFPILTIQEHIAWAISCRAAKAA
jgi:hypothetical protein